MTPLILLLSSAPSTDRDVPEGSTSCPVTPTCLAEVPRLRGAVVIEVAELGVGGFTAGAFQYRL